MSEPTPQDLIAEYLRTRDHLQAQQKAFAEYCKPFCERMAAIENQFLARANTESPLRDTGEGGKWNIACEAGTAFRQTGMAAKIVEREPYIDWILEDWDTRGAMLQIGAPQIDELRDWRQEHDDQNPPGVKVKFNSYINIRKA